MANKDPRRITMFYSGASAVVSFVTQPVPALDELIVIPIHYALCLRLARARGVKMKVLPWPQIRKIIWYGAGARLVTNFSLGLVPVVGMFSNALTAIVLTEFLGRYIDDALANPATPAPDVTMESLKTLFATALRRHAEKESETATEPPATGSAATETVSSDALPATQS